MQVVQSRDPESQRACTQHVGPCGLLVGGQCAHASIGFEQRARARHVECGRAGGTPVVDRDGDVVEQGVRTGEIKIDDAADTAAVPQHVVAKEIGVDRAARQALVGVRAVVLHFGLEQLGGGRVEKQQHVRHYRFPPRRAARVRHHGDIALARQMHLREHAADRRAMRGIDFLDVRSGHARKNARGLAVQFAQHAVRQIRNRLRAGNAVRGQMRHQVHVERQLVGGELFEQREHVTAVRRRHEIIGVLDAGRDALQFLERADRKIFEPRRELFRRDGGEDGHV